MGLWTQSGEAFCFALDKEHKLRVCEDKERTDALMENGKIADHNTNCFNIYIFD